MGHFRRGRAKLREVPQIVLDIILNLGIFVIECIFEFLDPMSSFCNKCYQKVTIGGRHLESLGHDSSRNITYILKANVRPNPH